MKQAKINVGLLRKYLSEDNEEKQPMIFEYESKQDLIDTIHHTNELDQLPFASWEEIKKYYDKYLFKYNNKYYVILFDSALNIYE